MISWNAFTAAGGSTVDGGTKTVTIAASGLNAGKVDVSLYANTGATPAGTSYRVRYYLANGASYTETWVVPASGPVTIAGVRVLPPLPQPQATWLTQLNGLTSTTQSFSKSDDANMTLGITSSGSNHAFALGWSGLLPTARGGTGLGTMGNPQQCLKVNSGGTGLEYGDCGSGGGGGGHTIQEEGASLSQRSKLNFLGGAITATDDAANDRTNVTVAINDADIPAAITRDSEINVQGTANQITSSGSGPAPTLALASPLIFPGKFTAAASGASAASANFPSGTSPTAPASGDFWNQSGALKFYDGATTQSLLFQSRSVNTPSPLGGGGALTGDLTLSCSTCEVTGNKNAASGYAGLTSGTKLNAAQGQEVWGLADLTDVSGTSGNGSTVPLATMTSLATNDVLHWGGTNWVNGASVAKADALTNDPSDCSANNFATAIAASGNLTCTQPSFSNLSGSATAGQVPNLENLNGTLDVASGGTGAAPGADDQLLVSDSTTAATWRNVANCTDSGGNHLNYSTSTNSFSCGTSTSGAALAGAGTNGIAAYNAGDDTTAARSDHTHRTLASVTWYFPGTPTTGVQNLTLVLPEGITNPAITDMRATVNTTSASSSTLNIQRCTASCTGTTPTFANIYSANLTLSANARTASKAAAPDQNVSGLAAGDQFKANLVTIGSSLADVTITMTYKYETTN